MIEAVLFDFNGVLVDDEGQHYEAMQRVLAEEDIALSREQYYTQILGLDDRTGFVEAYRRAQRTLTTELLKILVCPLCKAPVNLTESGQGLKCSQCRRVYPIRDDIPVMLVDEAKIEE